MVIQESKLIDCTDLNGTRTLHWNSGDSEDNWRNNKHSTQMNPKYWDNPIEYHNNSLGYRCKELNEYEDNNFILVMGCSYTEGVGLHEEDLWWHNMSEKYNLPVMNLGMGGSGIDFQFYNTTLYVKNKFPKPKMVVIQYPGEFRKTFSYPNRVNTLSQNQILKENRMFKFTQTKLQTWVAQDKNVPLDGGERFDANWYMNRYVVYPEQANLYNYMYYHSIKNIWTALGVPNAHWSWVDDFMPQDMNFLGVTTENAGEDMGYLGRDLAHPGVEAHKEAWQQIEAGVEKCLSL